MTLPVQPPVKLSSQFAEEIRCVLADKGWTQKELALRLDISEKHVSQLMRHHAGWSWELLDLAAVVLGVRWTVGTMPLLQERAAANREVSDG